jgi:hypothetical protein
MRIISLQITLLAAYCTSTLHTMHAMEITPSKKHKPTSLHEEFRPLRNIPDQLKLHKQTVSTGAIAQYNPGINDGEKAYQQKRLPVAKAALEKIFDCKLDEHQIPNITMICSGGGYRAMLCTIGSLCGANKIGILDATNHIAALSGSTWAVAPWIATQQPIEEFKEYVKECAAKSCLEFTLGEEMLVAEALEKKINKAPLTPVDPYGFCLANRLLAHLNNQRHTITLSDLRAKIAADKHPYPIFVAIDARSSDDGKSIVTGQSWTEFTVDTIRNLTNNIHIPTEAYGSGFKNGTETKHNHEKSLGYGMGTWGSAFGANIHDIIGEVIKNPVLREEIEALIPDNIEADRPLHFYAKVPNYVYKMDIEDKALASDKHLLFVDSGLEINLPYPPVSGICAERAPEILIFLDASAGEDIGNELIKVAAYAKDHNLPFPNIDIENIDKKTISIFKDETNKQTPVVIYMPRISDKELWEANKSNPEYTPYNLSGFDLHHETNNGFAKTQEFQYTPEHSTLVMNQTEFNMLVNRDKIIETIKWCIDRK